MSEQQSSTWVENPYQRLSALLLAVSLLSMSFGFLLGVTTGIVLAGTEVLERYYSVLGPTYSFVLVAVAALGVGLGLFYEMADAFAIVREEAVDAVGEDDG